MKCPLFTVGGYNNDHLPRYGFNDCLKEECAWWISGEVRCAITVLAAYTAGITVALDEIAKRLPQAGLGRER